MATMTAGAAEDAQLVLQWIDANVDPMKVDQDTRLAAYRLAEESARTCGLITASNLWAEHEPLDRTTT